MFKEEDTVDFRDLFDGPGNVQIPVAKKSQWRNGNNSKSNQNNPQDGKRQYSNSWNQLDIENVPSNGNSARRRKNHKNDVGMNEDYDYDTDSIPLTRV